jgi:peptidoglycan/LPS O-acetylase OafA/YrhL
MLQRPQSIFLLITVMVLLAMIWAPVWPKGTSLISIGAWLCRVALGITVYALISYRNRRLQVKLGLYNTLILIGSMGFTYYSVVQQVEKEFLICLLPATAFVSNLLANRHIRKDEKLVKDSARIR